jgi:hypothetical protein
MTEPENVTLVIAAIDEDLYERALIAANREGMTVPDLTMMALANYLGGNDGSLQPAGL